MNTVRCVVIPEVPLGDRLPDSSEDSNEEATEDFLMSRARSSSISKPVPF